MNTSDIPAVNRILKKEYESKKAPIIELIAAQTRDPFKILVSTILSARTKDEMTAQVSARLYKTVKKPADLAKLTQKQIENRLNSQYTHAIKRRLILSKIESDHNGKLFEIVNNREGNEEAIGNLFEALISYLKVKL